MHTVVKGSFRITCISISRRSHQGINNPTEDEPTCLLCDSGSTSRAGKAALIYKMHVFHELIISYSQNNLTWKAARSLQCLMQLQHTDVNQPTHWAARWDPLWHAFYRIYFLSVQHFALNQPVETDRKLHAGSSEALRHGDAWSSVVRCFYINNEYRSCLYPRSSKQKYSWGWITFIYLALHQNFGRIHLYSV